MFQTDSDEDVIFVNEKCALKSNEITFDQAKRLALQRDIDQESQPKQLAKPLTSQRSVTGERPVERVKTKMEEKKSDENFVKKKKKLKTGQVSLLEIESCAVDDGSPAEVQKEKKKCKKVDVVVIDLEEESSYGGGKMKEKKKKKKKKNVTESLNDARGSDVKNENEEEVSKNKKQKQAKSENRVETVLISVKEEEMKKKDRKEKKVKNKSVQIKSENVKIEKEKEEEQQAEKNKLPKKGKKEKNNILAVSTEESKEQVLEKKKKKKTPNDETKMEEDDTSVTKKKSKTKTKVPEKQVRLETPEEEAGEVENLKKKRVKNELKKRLKEKRAQNEVETPQIEGKSKRSKAEKDNMLNKKKDESTENEIVIIEEEETELKRKRKKEKDRKAPVEVSEIEETEPKKKKKKKRGMKGEEEEPLTLKCEEVKEQITESLPTVAVDTTSKKRKKISIKVETQAKNVSSETGAKKKKIKEEVKDQHESPQVDVVFLSEKSGNTDEITINQERRQALQMEIDQASQPQKPAKLEGFGQWSTAQFDSSDQQQKFLRLMGGFKKGFQQASGSTGRANMALGKGAQQQLQQGLLGEFERAHSRRVDFSNRGAGLGFTAPSNKKFSIDINTCRSVRFDD